MFKALGDPTRRRLLDSMRDRPGQTLTELEQGLAMTRFGVMKHLRVLEEAGLLVARREGRHKLHYLNALPIQEVADRWMAPYAKPLARFALDIKNRLERPQMAVDTDFVMVTYIRTTPEALWAAITDPEQTRQYYYGARVQPELRVGGRFCYLDPEGKVNLDGEVIEIDPPRRLVTSFRAAWAEAGATDTRVCFEIEPMGEACRLTLTHYDAVNARAGVESGWPLILSGLKTWLETGRPLPPAPGM